MTEPTQAAGRKLHQHRSPKLLSMANAALNGAVGDSLHSSGHPFTTKPGFYYRGSPLINPNIETVPGSASSKKIAVFVHGLCCDEHIWQFPKQLFDTETSDTSLTDYGELLYESLGYRPFYYRYNSGLPIAQNGEQFAQALDTLISQLSVTTEEVVLVGYSMGGLLIKSAQAWGSRHDAHFIHIVSKSFYLGSPHYGAPLEKLAKAVNLLLDHLPHPIVKMIGRILGQRSQGIKDLGFGDVTPYDNDYWIQHIEHHFVGGTLHREEEHPISFFLGDILVRQLSALPTKEEGHFFQNGIDYNYHLFPGVNHLQLQRNKGVFEYMVEHLGKPAKQVAKQQAKQAPKQPPSTDPNADLSPI